MLSSLSIQNVVLIDRLTINFKDNLCALTGETGAGKSILLDSLGLSLGFRSNTKLVRKGCEQAVVTAAFDLPQGHPVFDLLQEQGIQAEETILLKRTINADGRSKAFINDQLVSIALLKQIGEMFVEIHGQFDNQKLFDVSHHIELLDDFIDDSNVLKDLSIHWSKWQEAKAESERLDLQRHQIKEEEEYLRQSLHDLDQLSPETGEEETLTKLKAKLKNFSNIQENSQSALQTIEGMQDMAVDIWRSLQKMDEESQKALEAYDRMNAELEELLNETRGILNNLENNNLSLEEIDDRLFALKSQARKHQCQIDDLPQKREDIAKSLNDIENIDDLYAQSVKAVEKEKKAYHKIAKAISEQRRKQAKTLQEKVMTELPLLKLEKAQFKIQCEEKSEADWNEIGIDAVEFVVSTNPGSDFGRLQNIASGGELARFTLALKVALANVGEAQTMVFDEVDSGIGGATAAAVGDRLATLSDHKQILVVTHSPQVAAKANHHWIVAKSGSNDVTTNIIALEKTSEREEEIARMLSAEEITKEARAAAGKLLEKNAA